MRRFFDYGLTPFAQNDAYFAFLHSNVLDFWGILIYNGFK